MKIAIGTDSAAFNLKEAIKKYLINMGHEVKDFGIDSPEGDIPYYITAHNVAERLEAGEFERGILFCGTGMGMAIIANKHPGIYAAVCETPFAAVKSRSINNANVLTLGAFITTEMVAKEIVGVWLRTEFTEGWDENLQAWLKNILCEISQFEEKLFLKS